MLHSAYEFGYLSGYQFANSIEDQINTLKKYYREADLNWKLTHEQESLRLFSPEKSEGYFVVLYRHISNELSDEFTNLKTSEQFIQSVSMISLQRNGCIQDAITENAIPLHIRQSKKSRKCMEFLWKSQGCPDDFVLVPAQFGIRHRSISMSDINNHLTEDEFPLGIQEALCMVLTHENRFKTWGDIWISLPGNECSYMPPKIDYHQGIYIGFQGGCLKIFIYDREIQHSYLGVVTGFLDIN
jgi:hypothetical protein